MDTSSIIIGLVILAVFIGPIVLLHLARRKRERRQMVQFEQYVQSKGLQLTDRELWNHYGIGIDAPQQQLFYTKQHLDENREHLIGLADIASCETTREMTLPTTGKSEDDKVLDRLQLLIRFKDARKEPVHLEFYNRDESTGLSNELELTEKWRKRIHAHIRSN